MGLVTGGLNLVLREFPPSFIDGTQRNSDTNFIFGRTQRDRQSLRMVIHQGLIQR
jgi:hypothetical protein